MKKTVHVLIVVIMLTLSSCWVKNLHTAFEASDIYFDENLLGSWIIDSDDSLPDNSDKLIFSKRTKRDDESYDILLIRNQSWSFGSEDSSDLVEKKISIDTTFLIGKLGRIGRYTYLELSLSDNSLKDIENMQQFLTPNYFLNRIELNDNSLSLSGLNYKQFLKLADRRKIQYHQNNDDGPVLITAKTKQIKSFLTKYEKNSELFDSPEVYRRL